MTAASGAADPVPAGAAPVGLAAARRPLLLDAVFSRLMDNLTGGTFLAALALLAGAGNLEIALLAALPAIAQVVQLPAVALLLRTRDRRRMVVWCAGAARLVWIAIGGLAMAGALTARLLLLLVGAGMVLAVVATAAWNWWMRDLLPEAAMAELFGARLRGATVVSLALMVVAGLAIDSLTSGGREGVALGALFVLAGASGLAGIAALARTPHVDPPPSLPARQAFAQLRTAIRAADRGLVAGLALAGVAVSVALPFAAVYLLRGLGFSLLAATVVAAMSQLAYLAGLRGWVHVARTRGDRVVAMVSLAVLAAALLAWALTGWRGWTLVPAMGALHFVSGYALGGIELATTNLMLRSAPAANAPAHLAALSVVRAAASASAVLGAGALWEALGPGVLWSGDVAGWAWELRGFQVLCVVAAAACLVGVLAFGRLREAAGTLVEVVRAMRREVHHMSSVAGMRAFIHAVSYSVEFMAAPFAARPKRPARRRDPP